jgi:hypothetical protein
MVSNIGIKQTKEFPHHIIDQNLSQPMGQQLNPKPFSSKVVNAHRELAS